MGRHGRTKGVACARFLAGCTLLIAGSLPAGAAHAQTAQASPVQGAQTVFEQAPEPVYPTNTEPPVPGTEPPPAVLDEDYVSGDWIAQDGRVIPAVGIVTESID